MKRLIAFVLICVGSRIVVGQSIAASNFRYWYDPNNEVELQIRPVRAADKIVVRYTLVARQGSLDRYSIKWEGRNTYVEREGVPIAEKDSVISISGQQKRGTISFTIPNKP